MPLRYLATLLVVITQILNAGEPQPVQPVQPAQPEKPKPPQVVPKNPVAAPPAQPLPPEWEKLFNDVSGPAGAPKEAAAKEIIGALETALKSVPDYYLNKVVVELRKEDPKAREAALMLLGEGIAELRRGAGRIFNAAVHNLVSADEKLRQHGAAQLATMVSDAVVGKEVERLLNDFMGDAAAVAAAPEKIKALGAEAAGHLSTALEDERLPVRRGAADSLKALGPLAKDAVNDLAFLLDNEDKLVRRLAAQVLMHLGPDAVDVATDMVQYLEHEEKPVRRLAADVLKRIGAAAEEVAGDLAGLLTEDDKNTRALAMEVLMNMGPAAKGAGEDLIGIIDDTDNDSDSRSRAAQALGAIGPAAKEHLKLLQQHLNDPNPNVKTAVTEAVDKIQTGGK